MKWGHQVEVTRFRVEVGEAWCMVDVAGQKNAITCAGIEISGPWAGTTHQESFEDLHESFIGQPAHRACERLACIARASHFLRRWPGRLHDSDA